MERETAYATILALLVVGGVTGVTGAIPMTDGTDLASVSAADGATDDDATNETEMDDGVDDSRNLTVSLAEARESADAALSSPPEGEWRIVESEVHEADGYYEFEYALDSANATGEAEVRVDGSTGDVFRLEEEIEPEDGEEREREYRVGETEDEAEDDEDDEQGENEEEDEDKQEEYEEDDEQEEEEDDEDEIEGEDD